MRSSIKSFLFFSLLIGAASGFVSTNAQEYEPWTGAVVGANVHFSNNNSLKAIRRLINQGKTEDAVRESRKFIDRLTSNARSGRTSSYEYDAYNALCISLTANKEFDEAYNACDTAINMTPGRWQAMNSRGSLNYKTGKYSQALEDYRNALQKAPDVKRIRKILEHNVTIAEARVSGN